MGERAARIISVEPGHTIIIPRNTNHRIVWDEGHLNHIGIEISNNGKFSEGNRFSKFPLEYLFWRDVEITRARGYEVKY